VHHAIGRHEVGARRHQFGDVALLARAAELERRQDQAGLGAEELGAVVVGFGLVGGPRGLEQDGAAALQLDEGKGEVVDIEGRARVDLALAPAAVALAAAAELRVRLAADGSGIELAHEVQAAVEGVHADVVGAATAGEAFLREPRADARDAGAAGPGSLGVIDVAEHTGGDELLGRLHVGREPDVLSDHEQALALLRRGHELRGITGVGRHGLVEHHVLAGAQGGEGDLGMQVVGQRDRDDVDIGAAQQLPVIGDEFLDPEPVGGLASACRRSLRECHDLGGRVLLERIDVIEADGPGADDGDVEGVFFGHGGNFVRRGPRCGAAGRSDGRTRAGRNCTARPRRCTTRRCRSLRRRRRPWRSRPVRRRSPSRP